MTKSKAKSSLAKQITITNPEIVVQARYPSSIGVDIHLNLLVCCYQVCTANEIQTIHARFSTTASQIKAFAKWCCDLNPAVIVMESTGVLWRSPYEALEDAGFSQDSLILVNARDVKATIGRKTDREDAQRLAELARLGSLKRSMVPSRVFREMRILARRYQKITAQAATAINAYQKILNCVGCRASTVFSNVRGVAATAILEAKVYNKPNFEQIVRDNSKRLHHSPLEIIDALNFEISETMQEQLRAEKELIDFLQKSAQETMQRLQACQKPFEKQIEFLTTIPGIKITAARLIFSELCEDLKQYFIDVEHFTSWMGICPGNNISADVSHSGKSAKGNKWIRRVLIECANTVRNRKDSLRDRFMALKLRRGNKRAVVAIAHYFARVIYALLTKKESYKESVKSAFRDALIDRVIRSTKQLAQQGVEVVGTRAVQRDTGEIIALKH